MQVSEIDSVKIYNLSAGKALPDVCTYLSLQFYFNHFDMPLRSIKYAPLDDAYIFCLLMT